MLTTAIVFAVGIITMWAAHDPADHIAQTDKMAVNKTEPGRKGWKAVAAHVIVYHIVMAVMLGFVVLIFNLPVSILGFTSAILLSIITHAIIDRRWPIKWILNHVGASQFAELLTPVSGMYIADQSAHKWILWLCAILFAVL